MSAGESAVEGANTGACFDSQCNPDALAPESPVKSSHGKLTLVVTRTCALKDAAAAQQGSETGHVRGKIVLLVR